MAGKQYSSSLVQTLPDACIVDVTPPTFGGITSLVPQGNGSLKAMWSAATDAIGPISYDVYIAAGVVNAATLFQNANIVSAKKSALQALIYSLADETTYLGINQTYTVGVRARDGVGNQSSNTQLLTAQSSGVLPDCLVAAAASLASTSAEMTSTSQQMSDTAESIHNDAQRLSSIGSACSVSLKVSNTNNLTGKVQKAPKITLKITKAVEIDC
jgi:hypothetical protein